jgi:hypothetical protein
MFLDEKRFGESQLKSAPAPKERRRPHYVMPALVWEPWQEVLLTVITRIERHWGPDWPNCVLGQIHAVGGYSPAAIKAEAKLTRFVGRDLVDWNYSSSKQKIVSALRGTLSL